MNSDPHNSLATLEKARVTAADPLETTTVVPPVSAGDNRWSALTWRRYS